MKALLAILLAILFSGCATTYDYRNGDQKLKIRSHHEYPGGISVEYDGKGFKVQTGETSNSANKALSDVILQMLPLIQPIKGG
jgi:hypothetical protein